MLHRGLRESELLYRIPARQTTHGCFCNGLVSTKPGKLIDTKISFQNNHASIRGTMMAAVVLNVMAVNALFENALSNDIVDEYPEL